MSISSLSLRALERNRIVYRYAPSAFILLIVFLIWEISIRFFEISELVFPAPSSVLKSLRELLISAGFYHHFGVTLFEILAGFVLGAAGGILLGIFIGLSTTAERILYPYIIAFQTMPKVAIAPILVIWFGYGMTSKIVITATIAFFPLLANTVVGLRIASASYIHMLTAFTANRRQVFRLIRLPEAMPYIFAGLDVAAVLAVIGAIVGEFVGARAGLGYLILQKNFNFDMPATFAILIILSILGIAMHVAVVSVQKRVVFWVDFSGERERMPGL